MCRLPGIGRSPPDKPWRYRLTSRAIGGSVAAVLLGVGGSSRRRSVEMRWCQRTLARFGMVTAVSLVVPAGVASAQAARISKITLTASATSVTQDAWVTFKAQVSGSGVTPGGSVTFSDASNGSIIGASKLVGGTATIKTAALAPGPRPVVARHGGRFPGGPDTEGGREGRGGGRGVA